MAANLISSMLSKSKSIGTIVPFLVAATCCLQIASGQEAMPPSTDLGAVRSNMSSESPELAGPFVCDRQYETLDPLHNSTSMPQALTLDKNPRPIQLPSYIRYVALGDSYSAGMGASRQAPGSCMQRAQSSWPNSIASWLQYDGELDDNFDNMWVHAACSGYTTGDIMDKGPLDWLSPETHWITLTAGGNDIGFVKILTACLHLSGQSCSAVVADAEAQMEASLTDSVKELLVAITQRAPNAKVLVAGYPDIVPASSCSDGGFTSAADLDLLRPLVGSLNGHISAAVTAVAGAVGPSVTFVDVRGAFAGHQPCTSEEYINGINLLDIKGSFHPDLAGQCAYAHEVWTAMRA